MIGYVRGKISHLFPDSCFVDVNGVGYRVFIPQSTRQNLSKGAETTLFTYLNVREDALLLYGFSSQQEYDLFILLTSVSGIGPKVGLGILSAISPTDFIMAVGQKNFSLLTKIPGVGKKTAERIVLELKDKIGEADPDNVIIAAANDAAGSIQAEALQALLTLGYTQQEITPVLRKAAEATSVEEIIKLALKEFSGRS
ncbi:MAG: Holliday junction ATP-dependent helicase ruvA [Anaerosporomusa subterranea]|jgi:Holliday junction DNA helicase RuvA|nr:Holliday junction ATP-dependent helicase ruvA [Anaerosporomusa subterranea]